MQLTEDGPTGLEEGRLPVSLRTLAIRLGFATTGLAVATAYKGDRVGALIVAVGVPVLFALLSPRALILDAEGVRRLQFFPLWRPRKVLWRDAVRFFPSTSGRWPFVSYQLAEGRRRRLRLPWSKKDGSFPPLFSVKGRWSAALGSEELALLLDECRREALAS